MQTTLDSGLLAVDVGECRYMIEREANLESLWEAMDGDDMGDDERIPYWSELWPASFLLADWLQRKKNTLQGRTVLDLGCGLGLTAIVAAGCGARVIGMDYEPSALRYARANAARNRVSPAPLFTLMDWRAPALAPGSVDVMIGGDIMYEARFFAPIESLIRTCLAPGGVVWMGEPVRSVSSPAWDELRARGYDVTRLACDPVPTEGYTVTVNLWQVRMPHGPEAIAPAAT